MGRLAGLSMKSVLLLAALGACLGCGRTDRRESIRTHAIQSRYLKKDMNISVLLPPGYSPPQRYPVLYFFGDYGAGTALVTGQVATESQMRSACRRRRRPASDPRGCRARCSFMIETDAESTRVTTSSGMGFSTGRCESYFIEEVVPFVDGTYHTGCRAIRPLHRRLLARRIRGPAHRTEPSGALLPGRGAQPDPVRRQLARCLRLHVPVSHRGAP